MMPSLPEQYRLRLGSAQERTCLLDFIDRTYRELFPQQSDWSHLSSTVDRYLSAQTPLWWIDQVSHSGSEPLVVETPGLCHPRLGHNLVQYPSLVHKPIAVCWAGNGTDQYDGERYAHLFLLYVDPAHRHQGLATNLLATLEAWARARGDRQIGLNVFVDNVAAQRLYYHLGFTTQSLLLLKPLES